MSSLPWLFGTPEATGRMLLPGKVRLPVGREGGKDRKGEKENILFINLVEALLYKCEYVNLLIFSKAEIGRKKNKCEVNLHQRP